MRWINIRVPARLPANLLFGGGLAFGSFLMAQAVRDVTHLVVIAGSAGTFIAFVLTRRLRYPSSTTISLSLPVPSVAFAVRAVGLAALIAGRRRNVGSAWLDDLRGDPDAGESLTLGQKAAKIGGFFWAAFRFRLHDWFGWAWRPVDWMLATKSRRDGFRTSVVGIHVIYIAGTDGLHALFTLGLGWLAVTYAFVTGATTWLGKRRGIELAGDDNPPEV